MDTLGPLGEFVNLEDWARGDTWAAPNTHRHTHNMTNQANKEDTRGRQERTAGVWRCVRAGCQTVRVDKNLNELKCLHFEQRL